MALQVKIGAFGGHDAVPEGKDVDIDVSQSFPNDLKNITIFTKRVDYDIISALSFTYKTDGGDEVHVGPWGKISDGVRHKIELQPGEHVIELSGTFEIFIGGTILTSLKFVTRENGHDKKYGPYGTERGTPFSVPVKQGRIVAFFGRIVEHLDAIGVYVLGA